MESYSITLTTSTGTELVTGYTEAWWARKYAGVSSSKGFDEYSGITYETDVTVAGTTELKATPYAAARELEVRFFKTDTTGINLRQLRDAIETYMLTFGSVSVTRTFYGEDGKGVSARRFTAMITAISEWERTDDSAYITVQLLSLNPRPTSVTAGNLPDPGITPPTDWTAVNKTVDTDVATTKSNIYTWMGSGIGEDVVVTPVLLAQYIKKTDDNNITIAVNGEVITVTGSNPRSGYATSDTVQIVRVSGEEVIKAKLEEYRAETKAVVEQWWADNPNGSPWDSPSYEWGVHDTANGYYVDVNPSSDASFTLYSYYRPIGETFNKYRVEEPVFAPGYDYAGYVAVRDTVRDEVKNKIAAWVAANPNSVRTQAVMDSIVQSVTFERSDVYIGFSAIQNINEVFFSVVWLLPNNGGSYSEYIILPFPVPEHYGKSFAPSALGTLYWGMWIVEQYYAANPNATGSQMATAVSPQLPSSAPNMPVWYMNVQAGWGDEGEDPKAYSINVRYADEAVVTSYDNTLYGIGFDFPIEWKPAS